jgi:hypothetical protein
MRSDGSTGEFKQNTKEQVLLELIKLLHSKGKEEKWPCIFIK